MAVAQMKLLAGQAFAEFRIRDIAMVHRIGRLEIGETSVAIAVAAAHRGSAFDACRWLIDTLKQTVPIWKKEFFEDGAVWAQGDPFPSELTAGGKAEKSAKKKAAAKKSAVPKKKSASGSVLVEILPAADRDGCHAAGSGASAAFGQEQPPTFHVKIHLVNVFVNVTDAVGAPIGGLKQDDFTLTEDGVPQKISYFDRQTDMR